MQGSIFRYSSFLGFRYMRSSTIPLTTAIIAKGKNTWSHLSKNTEAIIPAEHTKYNGKKALLLIFDNSICGCFWS